MGILLVYDVTDEASFNNIRNWMRNIEQHASDNVNKVGQASLCCQQCLSHCVSNTGAGCRAGWLLCDFRPGISCMLWLCVCRC